MRISGKLARWILASFALAMVSVSAMAEKTDITVRVLSRDAKFIGSSMDGVRIALSDAETGEPLGTGVTRGGTGNTGKIMHDDRGRRAELADDSAAAFRTTLDLERPRRVQVTAHGPLSAPEAANTVTATQWVVPGRDLSGGDGWVLEMPGFVVDVVSPAKPTSLNDDADSIEVRARVAMMCGCPIKPGGLWDADHYEVAMTVRRDGKRLDEIKLDYAGETSRFAGQLPLEGPGEYEVIVHAYDPETGNTGVDRTSLVVE